MSTTATVDTNEGWTFPNDNNPAPELPTTTEPDNNWGIPPAAPSPPMSAVGQPRINDHAPLHWTACYNDYCGTHHQSKDNNYYPCQSRRQRRTVTCDCPLPHPDELLQVTHERRLNPVKACADWHRGKRVCPECRFLVNMENHHLRCSAAAPRVPLADITPPQEAPAEENPDAEAAAPPDNQIRLLAEIITTVQNTVIQEARHTYGIQRLLAQTMCDQHDADQRQLQRMARTLGAIITEQQRMNEQLQARPPASRTTRIHRTIIRRRMPAARPNLAGASVWTGDLLSRTWRNRLLGAAAGVALTLATLWLILVSAAMATVILRA